MNEFRKWTANKLFKFAAWVSPNQHKTITLSGPYAKGTGPTGGK